MATKGATRKGVSKGTSKRKQPRARRTPAWEAIERDYRAGVLSVREIARQYKVTEGAIRKRAKADHWTRDLNAAVQQAAKNALVRTEVRNAHAQETEAEVVEDAAQVVVELVRQHRADLRGGRQMAEMLMGQLQVFAERRGELEDLVIEETAADKKPMRRNAMLRAIALPAHAGVLRDLSAVLKNLIPLERQAFGMDAEGSQEPPKDDQRAVNREQLVRLGERMKKARAPVTIEG